MEVVARVMNGDEHVVELPDGATYGRLLDEIGENPEAAVVVVDGRPVPEDATIDADEVEVMRTVSGGCDSDSRPNHATVHSSSAFPS